MPLLLSIETATKGFSVALHHHKNLLAHEHILDSQTAASQLAVRIDLVLKKAHIQASSIEGVVVSEGPGSYTGLRIGVSTAKGICYALNIPLIAINTLQLLLEQVKHQVPPNALCCPMLDARRMEVYCMLAYIDGRIVEPTQALVINEHSFSAYVEPIYFFGEGAAKCQHIIPSTQRHFIDDVIPSAITVGQLGVEKFNRREFCDLANFEPLYLKDFLIKKPTQKIH